MVERSETSRSKGEERGRGWVRGEGEERREEEWGRREETKREEGGGKEEGPPPCSERTQEASNRPVTLPVAHAWPDSRRPPGTSGVPGSGPSPPGSGMGTVIPRKTSTPRHSTPMTMTQDQTCGLKTVCSSCIWNSCSCTWRCYSTPRCSKGLPDWTRSTTPAFRQTAGKVMATVLRRDLEPINPGDETPTS